MTYAENRRSGVCDRRGFFFFFINTRCADWKKKIIIKKQTRKNTASGDGGFQARISLVYDNDDRVIPTSDGRADP